MDMTTLLIIVVVVLLIGGGGFYGRGPGALSSISKLNHIRPAAASASPRFARIHRQL